MDPNTNQTLIGGGEGFTIYTAEENGKYLLILDESTCIGLLSDEDAEGLTGEKILEFASEQERSDHLKTLRYHPISP